MLPVNSNLVGGFKSLIFGSFDTGFCFGLRGFELMKTCHNPDLGGLEDGLHRIWVHVTIMSSIDADPSWSHFATTATTLFLVTMMVARALRVLSQLQSSCEAGLSSLNLKISDCFCIVASISEIVWNASWACSSFFGSTPLWSFLRNGMVRLPSVGDEESGSPCLPVSDLKNCMLLF